MAERLQTRIKIDFLLDVEALKACYLRVGSGITRTHEFIAAGEIDIRVITIFQFSKHGVVALVIEVELNGLRGGSTERVSTLGSTAGIRKICISGNKYEDAVSNDSSRNGYPSCFSVLCQIIVDFIKA